MGGVVVIGKGRGGQGVKTFRTTDKAGKVATARVVADTSGQEILIISAKAQVVRITLDQVRVTGRNTQGVIVWQAKESDDFVASIACFQETVRTEDQDEHTNGTTLKNGSGNGVPSED